MTTYGPPTAPVDRVGALSSDRPVTRQTRPSGGALPRREAQPRVRLRVRASLEVLDAAMSGLVALDDTTPTVLSAAALATAPSVA